MPRFLLVHPPLLGPAVWAPCAAELAAAGHRVAVPDLRPAVDPPAGWYARAADIAAAGTPPVDVVVAHSGAGVLMPQVVDRLGAGAAVFVDAVLPGNPTSDRFREFLATLPVEDGLFPRWSDWWPAEALAEAVPDPDVRASILADQPRLSPAFYDEQVPVPASWPPPRVGYLRLSEAYGPEADEARRLGWTTCERDGGHLDNATRAAEVAAEIIVMGT
jgi:hypothetical protein